MKLCQNCLKLFYTCNCKGLAQSFLKLKTGAWIPHMHLYIVRCLVTKIHKIQRQSKN